LRVLWLTNFPAYYRYGIWNILSKSTKFSLVFAEGLAHFSSKEIDWVNWKVMFTPLNFFGHGDKSWSGLRKELSIQDLVVVCGWEKWYYWRTLLFCKRNKIRTVIFYESTLSSHRFKFFFFRLIRRYILNLGDFILSPSKLVEESLHFHKINPEKIVSCTNPVNVEHISQNVLSERKIFTPSRHNFLYIGQLISRKNIANLIWAFSEPQFKDDFLTILGSGNQKVELEQLCSELKLLDRVQFLPHSAEATVMKVLAQNQTLILPSTEEVWGMVAAEALAAKLGVIVSDKCGIAPTISSLEGVWISNTEPLGIADSMSQAKGSWTGLYEARNLEKFKPRYFCDIVLGLIDRTKYSFEEVEPLDFRVQARTARWTWITNVPANYRVAIWNHIKNFVDLSVFCIDTEMKSFNLQSSSQFDKNSKKREHSGLWPRNQYEFFLTCTNSDVLVVGGWHRPTYLFFLLLRKVLGRKTIIHYGSTIRTHLRFDFLFRIFRKNILNLSSMVVTYGDTSARSLHFEGFSKNKIASLFNPVDSKAINSRIKVIRKENENINGHKFLYVGQLIDRKGLDSLILAFKEVREHNDTLKIVGSGRNQKILQNRIWDLEMDSYIEMIDHLDFNSLMGVYAESQTLVLPSSKEVWGLVVNEALAAQLHVVVSRMSGVSEILESLDNAYVYGNGLQGLIEAMRRSRDNWRGWKDEPFILSHSTIEFAELLLSVSRKLD